MDNKSQISTIPKLIKMLTDIAIIVGIVLGFLQLRQSMLAEKRQNTINAIMQTRSNEFLQAYARLKAIPKQGSVKYIVTSSVTNDLNYVMNTCDHIALLYINDLIDRCLVKKTLYQAIEEIVLISETKKYPKEYMNNIIMLKYMMSKESCE